jgi:Arc/MetJ-type ribon-helix-helix transcriptional regulator
MCSMTKKLSISLPDKMDATIEDLVEQGMFSTKTAVIEEGLRMIFMKYAHLEYTSVSERMTENTESKQRNPTK